MLSAEQAEDAGFWSRILPELAIDAPGAAPSTALPDAPGLLELLRTEGYLNVPDVLDGGLVARLRAGIVALVERGLPPVFLWVYDDVWRAYRSLGPFLGAALGPSYRVVPEIWAWHVAPADDALGWQPHRDHPRLLLVDADGAPRSLTVWLPLTDATPLNGCIYLVPAHLDADLRRIAAARDVVRRPQDVRAQPATAGSLLAWNHGLLHWGGRSSRRAPGPRISLGCEFQRATIAPLARPLLDPGAPPPFALRVWLVARAILGYRHMYALPPDLEGLARAIQSRGYERFANM